MTLTRLAASLLLVLLTLSRSMHAQAPIALRVAAASDLTPVLPAIADAYEKQTGVHLLSSFGSSATLTEQIRSGAPFDIFLSADTLHPQLLVQGGQSLSPAPVPYAHGVLVLWARKDSPAQPLSLAALSTASRIAMANPAHAPYGLAAQQFLQHQHLWDAIQPHLVTAENISQTAQFAESGNAQLGLLSLTTANTAHFRQIGSYITIPADTYAPIVQAAVVVRATHQADAARRFLDWLTSPAVQTMLPQWGLQPAH